MGGAFQPRARPLRSARPRLGPSVLSQSCPRPGLRPRAWAPDSASEGRALWRRAVPQVPVLTVHRSGHGRSPRRRGPLPARRVSCPAGPAGKEEPAGGDSCGDSALYRAVGRDGVQLPGLAGTGRGPRCGTGSCGTPRAPRRPGPPENRGRALGAALLTFLPHGPCLDSCCRGAVLTHSQGPGQSRSPASLLVSSPRRSVIPSCGLDGRRRELDLSTGSELFGSTTTPRPQLESHSWNPFLASRKFLAGKPDRMRRAESEAGHSQHSSGSCFRTYIPWEGPSPAPAQLDEMPRASSRVPKSFLSPKDGRPIPCHQTAIC